MTASNRLKFQLEIIIHFHSNKFAQGGHEIRIPPLSPAVSIPTPQRLAMRDRQPLGLASAVEPAAQPSSLDLSSLRPPLFHSDPRQNVKIPSLLPDSSQLKLLSDSSLPWGPHWLLFSSICYFTLNRNTSIPILS